MTERTVYAWYSGRTAIPYAAYKLLRILRWFELPGPWAGWSMHSGKLWSPEGLGFAPSDASWWTILVRKASQFDDLVRSKSKLELKVDELAQLLERARAGGAPGDGGTKALGAPLALGPGEVPVTLHFSLTHETQTWSAVQVTSARPEVLVTPQASLTREIPTGPVKTGHRFDDGKKTVVASSAGSFVPLSTAPYGRWFNSPSRFPRGGEE